MAVIQSVQSGSETIVSGDGLTINISITTVTLANSALFCTWRDSDGQIREQRHSFTEELEASQIVLTRFQSSFADSVTVEWYVYEWDSSVTVQRGIFSPTTNAESQTITSVNTGSSYVTYSMSINTNESWRWTADLTSSTNIDFDSFNSGGSQTDEIAWQVIEFDSGDAAVQKISGTVGNGDTSTSPSITSVDTSATYIGAQTGFSEGSNFNAASRNKSRCEIDSSTQITFTHSASSTSPYPFVIYVVEMLDGSTVQSGQVTIAASGTSTTATITALTNGGMIQGTSDGNQLNGSATGIEPGDASATQSISGTTVTFERGGDEQTLVINWFAVDWNAGAAVSAAITGTATASITEVDIVAGGKTIIITLTGDTFKAAGTGPIGSTADTQALIDGFDAASSPANGWDLEVRDKALTSEVVRTSSTVATWTVAAQAGYDISAQEVITGTIPTDVLVTGAGAITAVPTFTVDAVAVGGLASSMMMMGVGF